MTQSNRPGLVMGFHHDGNLINHNGLFTITSSHDWRTTDEAAAGLPCRCSLNYLAGFYDEDGYGLMQLGAGKRTYSLSAPLLYPEAKHGFILGYFHQGTNFGVFADATAPTATLRNFGSATYGSNIKGYMSGLDAGSLVFAEAWANLKVSWGDKPSIQGMVMNPEAVRATVSLNRQGVTVTGYYRHTISAVLNFHGTDWSDEHKAFHNGTIGCVRRCQVSSESTSKWGGLLVDNGSGGVDPFRLVGTFGLYQYVLDGHTVDWMGLLFGETPTNVNQLNRGYGLEPRSPGRTMVRHVGRVVSEWFGDAHQHDYSGTVNIADLDHVIHQAATIDSFYFRSYAVPMYVDYSNFNPDVGRQGLGIFPYVVRHGLGFDHHGNGHSPIPIPFVRTFDYGINIPSTGSATYTGLAGGFYTSRNVIRGGFVSTIDLGVDFGNAGPTLRGSLGYDFGGITGKLSMSGGSWVSSINAFSDGILACASGCQGLGPVAVWSAQLVDVTGKDSLAPEGVIGKFGAEGIRQGQETYDMYGLFAAVDEIMPAPPAAMSTYFPTTPHSMVSNEDGRYYRRSYANFLSVYYRPPTVVYSSDGNFVHPGGTMQLASRWWDWRSDDYANCYCTMFLTGNAYDSDGKAIKMGLSSDPRMRWSSIDYSDAKHGWVFGMYRLDLSPLFWGYHGKYQMGIFVDGTEPDNLPTSGSAAYIGYGTGYAMPSWSTLASDIQVIQNEVSIDVNWASGLSPSVSGVLTLAGLYDSASVRTDVRLTLEEAQWNPDARKFATGSISCNVAGGIRCDDHMVSWGGMFVDTGSTVTLPGLFAGAYSAAYVSLSTGAGTIQVSTYSWLIPHADVWDLYGWFTAQPTLNVDRKDELLKLPERAVKAALQEGFDKVYYIATDTQRDRALRSAGLATVDANIWGFKRIGYVNVNSNYTGFWTYSTGEDMSIGIRSSGEAVNSTPTTGGATYTGNAVGFYKSTNGEGVLIGDVSMSMTFSGSNVSVTGTMDLDFGGTTGSFTMDHDGFTGRATDGNLGCGTGCEGVWGGSFVETADNRPSDTAPGGFLGSFGLDGAMIGTDTYDALGAFSATVEP